MLFYIDESDDKTVFLMMAHSDNNYLHYLCLDPEIKTLYVWFGVAATINSIDYEIKMEATPRYYDMMSFGGQRIMSTDRKWVI